jgi:hypothetical protein
MPSGNLNSGRSRDTDDLKVRPLKVKGKNRVRSWLCFHHHVKIQNLV